MPFCLFPYSIIKMNRVSLRILLSMMKFPTSREVCQVIFLECSESHIVFIWLAGKQASVKWCFLPLHLIFQEICIWLSSSTVIPLQAEGVGGCGAGGHQAPGVWLVWAAAYGWGCGMLLRRCPGLAPLLSPSRCTLWQTPPSGRTTKASEVFLPCHPTGRGWSHSSPPLTLWGDGGKLQNWPTRARREGGFCCPLLRGGTDKTVLCTRPTQVTSQAHEHRHTPQHDWATAQEEATDNEVRQNKRSSSEATRTTSKTVRRLLAGYPNTRPSTQHGPEPSHLQLFDLMVTSSTEAQTEWKNTETERANPSSLGMWSLKTTIVSSLLDSY